MKKILLKNNDIMTFFWFIALIGYMFQSYIMSLSKFIVPCLLIFLILEVRNIKLSVIHGWKICFCGYVLYLLFCMERSVFAGNKILNILRFLFILIVIPLSGIIEDGAFDKKWKVFKILSVIKAVMIITVWIYVFIQQEYWPYRLWAQSNSVGDIYIVGKIPRIQLNGTALLVVGFGIDLFKTRKFTLYNVIMLLSGLAAGNSAYVLGYVLLLICCYSPMLLKWISRRNWKAWIVLFMGTAILVLFGRYAITQWHVKANYSNAVRLAQANILLKTNVIWGNGLGYGIFGTALDRTYRGDQYFELQTLYILNQVGLLGLLTFYVLTITPYIKKQKDQMFLYLVYLVFSFWNPYCFDSTHIFTLIMISNVKNL